MAKNDTKIIKDVDFQHIHDSISKDDFAKFVNIINGFGTANLSELGSKSTLLHWVCGGSRHDAKYKFVEFAVKKGADVNAVNVKGDTALHHACEGKSPQTVLLLLNNKADATVANNAGETPLHNACKSGMSGEIIQKFLDAGARPDVADKKGFTPLHYAADNKDTAVLKLLLDAVEMQNYSSNKQGHTPVHIAAANKNKEALDLLLKKAVSVDTTKPVQAPTKEIAISLVKSGVSPEGIVYPVKVTTHDNIFGGILKAFTFGLFSPNESYKYVPLPSVKELQSAVKHAQNEYSDNVLKMMKDGEHIDQGTHLDAGDHTLHDPKMPDNIDAH